MKKYFSIILILISNSFFVAAQFSLTDSLIAVYKLSGNAVDSTSNNNSGAMIGCLLTADRFGNAGGALNFNGTSDYIDITPGNSKFKPTTFPISVSAWIRFTGNAGGAILINDFTENYYHGILFGINTATNQLSISYCDGGAIGSGTRRTKTGVTLINDGQWHLVAGVIRGQQDMDIYIDCKNDGGTYSGTGGTIAYDNANGVVSKLDILASSNPFYFFKGDIDEIRFYHRELSADDISRLFKDSNYPFPAVTLGPDQFSCLGGSIVLNSIATNANTYLWSTGANSQTLSVSTNGAYSVTVFDNQQCQASDTVNVNLNSILLQVSNQSVCFGSSVTLIALGAPNYTWSPSTGLNMTSGNSVIVNTDTSITYSVIGDGGTCFDTATVTVTVNPVPTIIASSDTLVCQSQNCMLSVSGANSYLWSPSLGLSNSTSANPIANPVSSQNYMVTGSNQFGCTDTDTVTVNVIQPPAVSPGYDSTSFCHDVIQLHAYGVNNLNFHWEPSTEVGNSGVIDPLVFPTENTTYSLVVIDTTGCEFSFPLEITYAETNDVAIPNAFSPNDDGRNDLFKIIPICNFELDDFRIYNRWGELVFETNLIWDGWDGKCNDLKCSIGVYAYVVIGHTSNNQSVLLKGNVTLVL